MSDVDRENLLDNMEQDKSRGRRRTYADVGVRQFDVYLLSVLGSLWLIMSISTGHRWGALSEFFFLLILPAFTCNTASRLVLASDQQEPSEGKLVPTATKETLVLQNPSAPSLSHQCPMVWLCIWSPLGILMPLPSYPDCAHAAKSNSEEKWTVRFWYTNASCWFLSHTDKPQAIPKKSQWHI